MAPLPNRNRRWWALVVIVIAALVLLAAFGSLGHKEIPVRTATVQQRTIESTIGTNGTVEPVDSFQAHAPAATTVERILVTPGQQVRRGQMLVQMSDADARATAAHALSQMRTAEASLAAVRQGGTQEEVMQRQAGLVKARADVEAARRNLEAMRRLQTSGAASGEEVTAAENRLRNAEADLAVLDKQQTGQRYSEPEVARAQAALNEATAAYQAAQDLLKNLNITSPIDGTVYAVPVRQGQFVNSGDLLVQVGRLQKMQVRAFVDEPEIGRLAIGQPVNITWDAIPGRVWHGSLAGVPSAVSTRGTRTVGEILVAVDNSDAKLLPNVNVNVTIVTGRHENALSVPREAIHEHDSVRYIFEVVGGELKRRDVETGLSNLTEIEVMKGVGANAIVALGSTTGQPLREGLNVRTASQP